MSEQLYMLQPSLIEGAGVGCFAISSIAKGERLAIAGRAGTNRHVAQELVPESHLKYCPLLESGLFLAPEDFATMSVFWYINHARTPNVEQRAWRLHAAEDIEPGEEMTLYYPDLLTHPSNKEWVVPELHV